MMVFMQAAKRRPKSPFRKKLNNSLRMREATLGEIKKMQESGTVDFGAIRFAGNVNAQVARRMQERKTGIRGALRVIRNPEAAMRAKRIEALRKEKH